MAVEGLAGPSATPPMRASDEDRRVVAELLGREPQGQFEVVLRDAEGVPRVLRNAPILDDGTPMPTLYWLVSAHDRLVVSRLESTQAIARVQEELAPEVIAAAHDRYRAEREALMPADHTGPTPSAGVGGTRRGVKCLHAHYAYHLAGGDDPVGEWVAEQLAASDAPDDGPAAETPVDD